MRILHVAHQQLRKYGYTRVSWAQKLYYGLIKNHHNVQTFSDRDVAAFEAPLGIRELGKKKSNQRLLQTIESFKPELIIVGHCDIITNETLNKIRTIDPNIVIVGCNNDPLFVPENTQKIKHRCDVVDAMFVSTGLPELIPFQGKRATLHHMPNPVDPAIETFDSSQKSDFKYDLIFCSKETSYTQRGELVINVKSTLPDEFVFNTPGSFGQPGVWGLDYDLALSNSKMGLNLNRQEGDYWYSSARMAQLAGNGLLTFTHASNRFDRLMPKETLVYFSDADELSQKINQFYQDDDMRKTWAANTRAFFHEQLNSTLYAQYIVCLLYTSPSPRDS